jgi:hypothetical protein
VDMSAVKETFWHGVCCDHLLTPRSSHTGSTGRCT